MSKNSEVCTPETSGMKRTSVHVKIVRIRQLCNPRVSDFVTAFRPVRKFSGPLRNGLQQSHGKITNLTITELFYSRILNMNRGTFTQEVSGVYASPVLDTDDLNMALRARKVPGVSRIEKRAPGPGCSEAGEH